MEESFKKYVNLATRHEDLKSEERVLTTAFDNIREIKTLLLEEERKFCLKDQELRSSQSSRTTVKDSMRKRCFNLIDHLVHYKCVVECLSGDILAMESNLVNDDEYIHLSLIFREAELAIQQSIRMNQQRNEVFLNMHDEEAQSYLSEVELKWRLEHQDRRKLISQLISNQSHFVVDKITRNLEQQQLLLNQRYQSINNLIKLSYNHFEEDNNNDNHTINKNQA